MLLPLLAAALAAQQVPLPPGSVAPGVLGVTPEALHCVERHLPAAVRMIEEAAGANSLDAVAAARPPFTGTVAAIRQCFETSPARPGADNVAVGHVFLQATAQVQKRRLLALGVAEDTLRRLDASPQLAWLPGEGSALTLLMEEAAPRLLRSRVPPQARRQVLQYLWIARTAELIGIWMRPPARRAVWLGGAIEAGDYPRDALRANITGSGTVFFEVRPNGAIGRCVVVRTSGHTAFGRATCRAISRRYLYQPAIGADGRPAPDSVLATVGWRLP